MEENNKGDRVKKTKRKEAGVRKESEARKQRRGKGR